VKTLGADKECIADVGKEEGTLWLPSNRERRGDPLVPIQ